MAAFAVGAELAPMNVCVAIRALGAHVLEDEAGVAFGAAHLFMHATQGITGVIVIEFRIGSYWLPTRVGMAILTRGRDGTMRIGYLGLRTAYWGPHVVDWLFRSHADKQGRKPERDYDQPACTVHRSPV